MLRPVSAPAPVARALQLLAVLLLTGATPGIAAADEHAVFRVCADPNNLPLSSKSGAGLENKIAELWAEKLGQPVEYTWFPQRRGFIRNTLKARDESSGEFKCDVVMGIAAGVDQLLTTKPYYRSTYALVYAGDGKLKGIESHADFLALEPGIRESLKIGAFTPTPGTLWLSRHGLGRQMVAFPAMSGDPNAYPGEIVEKELAAGRLDAAVLWGPIAGYFATQVKGAELVVLPLSSEAGIRFDFSIAAGVRHGDAERKDMLENLIDETAADIERILRSYGVPLLELESEGD